MLWLIICLVVGLGLFLYWQLIIAEGVYLGQKTVTYFYDLTAHKYNQIKDFEPQYEHDYLGLRLSKVLGEDFNGLVLDVATGTGRLPLALQQVQGFQGQIIGLDHAKKMLAIARQADPTLPLLIADAMHLPFAPNTFPVVTCLEVLEFLPSPKGGLAEMVRVLKFSGVLLTTRRCGWETYFLPGKTWTRPQMQRVLQTLNLWHIKFVSWQGIYDQVWARKHL